VQDLFKTHYGLEPGRLQTLLATIQIPWSFKIIFGFISDNVAIRGSKRKSYLVIGSIIQIISMLVLAFWTYQSVWLAATCTFLTTMSIAFSDVIVDSLMVI
jgi:MFS-type transporter involved in bile tolerance (Atg22 family)